MLTQIKFLVYPLKRMSDINVKKTEPKIKKKLVLNILNKNYVQNIQ